MGAGSKGEGGISQKPNSQRWVVPVGDEGGAGDGSGEQQQDVGAGKRWQTGAGTETGD